MFSKTLYSSASDEWETPQALFDELDREFHFTLDAAATKDNAKCDNYFTPETDGLKQKWGGQTVWLNPPYGRSVKAWMKKAYEEGHKPGTTVVALVFARTDTAWFHEYVYQKAEIRFLRGRLKFGQATNVAPAPSMIIVWRGPEKE